MKIEIQSEAGSLTVAVLDATDEYADLYLNFQDRQDWLATRLSDMTFAAYRGFVAYCADKMALMAQSGDTAELQRVRGLLFALARFEMDVAHFVRGIGFEQRQDHVAQANAFRALARKSCPDDRLREVDAAWEAIVSRGANFGWTSPGFESAEPKRLFRDA